MSDSVTQPAAAETPSEEADQQVTSKIPTTSPAKNPKRVAAGKTVAERTRLAREAQKKAAAKAATIIANNKAKETPVPETKETPVTESEGILTTTQWLSVVSIFVSMVGLYYKREGIKRVFSKPQTPPSPSPASSSQQRPPPDSSSQGPKKGIRPMD